MSAEITKLSLMHRGTLVRKVYEAYDRNGSTSFELNNARFVLRRSDDNTIVQSGSCIVKNNSIDKAGNTIKTLQLTLNLQNTDIDASPHYLLIYVRLSTSQYDVFRQPIMVRDWRA